MAGRGRRVRLGGKTKDGRWVSLVESERSRARRGGTARARALCTQIEEGVLRRSSGPRGHLAAIRTSAFSSGVEWFWPRTGRWSSLSTNGRAKNNLLTTEHYGRKAYGATQLARYTLYRLDELIFLDTVITAFPPQHKGRARLTSHLPADRSIAQCGVRRAPISFAEPYPARVRGHN